MNWTKEIPTVDGWYWVKFKGSPAWVVEIVDSCIVYDDEEPSHITAEGFEFYGPLEEPE